jgi:hypothetical protein
MNNIEKMINILDVGGWCKEEYEHNGAHCILGAMKKATNPDLNIMLGYTLWAETRQAEFDAIFDAILELYPDAIDNSYLTPRFEALDRGFLWKGKVITEFNDMDDISYEDVHAVLTLAAQKLSEPSN